MTFPDLDSLTRAATANLAAHFTYVQERTTGMSVSRSSELILTDCGLPCDTFNAVCAARLTPENANIHIQQAISHFKSANRPFSWWLSPGDQPSDLGARLRDAGLQEAETELAMAADLAHLDTSAAPTSGLSIRRVTTASQLRDFATVIAANWSPPDELVLRFYERAAPVLLTVQSPLWQFVGYVDGVPAAASELVFGGGVAGLYSVCTLAAYRGRGFGSDMTLTPLIHARAAGQTTAILQASEQGSRIYQRLGFQPFGTVTEYKP